MGNFLIATSLIDEAEASIGRFDRGTLPREETPASPAVAFAIVDQGRLRARAVASGMGADRIERAIATFAAVKPEVVLIAGVAGGLRDGIAPGDIILATSCLGEDGESAPVDDAASARLFERLEARARRKGGVPPRRGPTLEVNKVASTPAEKRSLAVRFADALVVQMEDRAAARAARAIGAKVVVARAVVDKVDDEVPDLSPGLNPLGRPRPLAFAAHLARNPSAALHMPRLAMGFAKALGGLGAIYEEALEVFS